MNVYYDWLGRLPSSVMAVLITAVDNEGLRLVECWTNVTALPVGGWVRKRWVITGPVGTSHMARHKQAQAVKVISFLFLFFGDSKRLVI